MPRVLSICTGMGLLDRAFIDAGFEVTPGCEIDPEQRELYAQVCGGEPLAWGIDALLALDLPRFDGVIGGPPCQSHTRLRAMRKPKFPDLTPEVNAVLEKVRPAWFLFENVCPLDVPRSVAVRLDAMHYGKPHQSRARWFTHSSNIAPPPPLYSGDVDSLMAYSIVAGRIYGPKRAAVLQGYPAAAGLRGRCSQVQKGLANAVHYGLAFAWAESIREPVQGRLLELEQVGCERRGRAR